VQTIGISPKVIAALVTAIVGWLVTRYGIDLDPDAAVAVTIALLTAAGVIAPPGLVVEPDNGSAE
jgi:uncharacterized membrane protein YjjP (DUF1212 family)